MTADQHHLMIILAAAFTSVTVGSLLALVMWFGVPQPIKSIWREWRFK